MPVGPDDLLALSRSFQECRVLLTGAELDVFTLLREPLGLDEIASRLGADRRALAILLDALAAMELLQKKSSAWRTPPDLAPFLSADSPASVLPMLLHAATLWRRWSSLTQKVSPRAAETLPEASGRAFIGAMHVIASKLADGIVQAVAPGGARRLLDVGGASGTYTISFLKAVPSMTATLFDRREVVEMARERLEAAHLLPRVTLVPGDFSRDELPGGHDLAWVSAIIHQNSRAENRDLFGKIFRALVRGGRIVLRDHVMSPDRTSPRAGALFAVNMLVGTSGGGTYTGKEIEEDLSAAGFSRVKLIRPGERMDALVEAFRPAP